MNTYTGVIKGFKGLVAIAMALAITACGGSGGGGGDDDTSSTSAPIVSRGVITQLGSIWVNGCRYVATASGSYKIDDNPSTFDKYEVGMNVSIKGRKQSGSTNCEADEVEYEAELEGKALGGKINGIRIIKGSTVPAGTTLDDNSRYEVSGFWIDDNTLEATFIKDDDDGDFIDEIKGTVKNDSPASFQVYGITFNWTGTPDVKDDDFVEVHFDNCSAPPNVTCDATRVELEDDYFDKAEGMEVEVEGAVNLTPGSDCPPAADIEVDGVCVDSSAADFLDGLVDKSSLVLGSRVEAEGHMIAATPRDYLRADKIKGRGNRVRIESIASMATPATATDPCTFKLIDSKISVEVLDCTTAFEGDHSLGGPLNIGNLNNEEVEVRGIRTGDTSMMALRVKESGLSGGSTPRHELRAEVDLNSVDSGAGRVKVMTLVIEGNGGTELEVDDTLYTGTLTQFLNLIDDNDDPADGSRDILEVGFPIIPNGGSDANPYIAEEMEIEEEDD